MSRDRFKQAIFNPYFKSSYYLDETSAGKNEQKVFSFLNKINIFKKKKKNDQNS